ncbi:hypothetical protein AB0N18_02690 [Streptomyces griseoincarnatus]
MTAPPPAALAVIRAAIEDTPLAELGYRPDTAAQRIAAVLESEGWTITRTTPPNGTQTAA